MKLNLPKIELREPEKVWLSKIYEKIKLNQPVEYRIIRSELVTKIPSNFNPDLIDNKLLRSKTNITLLGVFAIDSDNDILIKANKILNFIRDCLIKTPKLESIDSNTIANSTGIPFEEVALILSLVSQYGQFWRIASGRSEDLFGYTSIDFGDDYGVYNQYINFESIEKLIIEYYKEEEAQTKKRKVINAENIQTDLKGIDNFSKIRPIFHSPIPPIQHDLCFILMPFTEAWSDRVYKKYIRSNIEDLGLQTLRADNLSGAIIMEDIWININRAAFIIADVTNINPNVMYELGIVHTLGKPAILITQDTSNIPFDFRHLRHLYYQDNADGLEKFGSGIKKIVNAIYKECYPDFLSSFNLG